jgi:hypothetical protein
LLVAGTVQADVNFTFPPVGGMVMAPDQQTLIVSITSQGKLAYIDTLAEQKLKEVEVDFQPTLLAVQGKKLFAAVKGAPRIKILDPDTAKEVKEVKLPGEPLSALHCHPGKGLIYAVNLKNEVFAINPETGAFNKTKAKGQLLFVDPSDGGFVYTGIQKPITDVVVIEEAGGNKVKLSLMKANASALMLKYKVEGTDLTLVAANDNAAINGRAMAVSSDGKQIAMAGGGGWRSKNDPKANYAVAVFETGRMTGQNGQVDTGPYPNHIAFHPVLNLGAAFNTKEIVLFNAKSFVKKGNIMVADKSFNHSGYMIFGGKGTKIIHCSYNAPIMKDSVLQIFSLSLSQDEHELLKKAYSDKKQ